MNLFFNRSEPICLENFIISPQKLTTKSRRGACGKFGAMDVGVQHLEMQPFLEPELVIFVFSHQATQKTSLSEFPTIEMLGRKLIVRKLKEENQRKFLLLRT